MGERRCAYMVLVGKSEGRRPLETPRGRRKDNFKMDLREVGWGAQTGSIITNLCCINFKININNIFLNLNEWFDANLLSLNYYKTDIHVTPKRTFFMIQLFAVTINVFQFPPILRSLE
jgi:hypothetical protein